MEAKNIRIPRTKGNSFNAGKIVVPALKGDKPIKGVDYWTEGDKREIVDEVEQIYNENHTQKMQEYNSNAEQKEIQFNNNANQKVIQFNQIIDATAKELQDKVDAELDSKLVQVYSDIDEVTEEKKEELEAINNYLEPRIESIESQIPVQATSENQLADKEFVNSSISTNTANFIGTFNTLAELQAYSGKITPNDYAFVKSIDILGNAEFRRYKYNGSWVYEYTLNNSSFTAKQWEAINSGITSGLVEKLEGIDLSKFAKKEELPTKTSELENDSGFLTEHQSLENYATKKYVEDYVNSLDGNEVLY